MLFYFVYMWRTLPPVELLTVFWDIIFLWEQFFYSLMEQSLYYYLNAVNIRILSLNFLS